MTCCAMVGRLSSREGEVLDSRLYREGMGGPKRTVARARELCYHTLVMSDNRHVMESTAADGPDLSTVEIKAMLEGVFAIEDITTGLGKVRATRVRGEFLQVTGSAWALLSPRFAARGYKLAFRRDDEGDSILIMARQAERPQRVTLAIILTVATVFSMLFTHAVPLGHPEMSWALVWSLIPDALAFTAGLLAILVAHELGHFFVARHFGVAVSLPLLIPFPASLFGTMGAVIVMREEPPHRRALLLISAAGPLCGMVVALPVVLIGLALSEVAPLPLAEPYLLEGNSLLYALLKRLVLGEWLPSGGMDVMLHPLAMAGWAGLWVTFLNLIPGAQLDGGHIAQALLGRRARYVTYAVAAGTALLGLLWTGWLIWTAIILFFSRHQALPADDITPLTRGEKGLALFMLVMLLLTFVPWPLRIVDPLGNLGLGGFV